MMTERGQTLAWAAVAVVVMAAMMLLVLNGGALIQGHLALSRAVEDAAVAGLRSATVGSYVFDHVAAKEQARTVLRVELANIRGLQEAPADLAEGADIIISDADHQVQVTVLAHVCPPAWRGCLEMKISRAARLETSLIRVPTATPVPPIIVPFPSPTPTPRPIVP